MAKRQKKLRTMLYRNSQSNDSSVPAGGSSTSDCTSRMGLTPLQIAVSQWRDSWCTQFSWIEFNADIGKVFCKICRDRGGRTVFATTGSINIRISAIQDHAKSEEHRRLIWAHQHGERTMERGIAEANRTCDEAMQCLFQAAYYMGKELLPFCKFPGLCALLVSVKANITESLYHDEKSCAEILYSIATVVQKKVLDRVRDSKFYGVMIDESTDISVTGHLVVFASFVEEGMPQCVFLGLIHIEDGKKDAEVIFETLIRNMKEWGLDVDKCVAFGSDGAATMTGKNNGVAARLKAQVNPFLTSVHCVAHRTNLAALDASKAADCKELSKDIDNILNIVAGHFKKSSKRKNALQRLQSELSDTQKTLKRYQKIRWLSRWQAVTTLCDSLESVLTYYRDTPATTEDSAGQQTYLKLRSFKYIYCLYFLADILHLLSMLSRIFQHKFVDVTTVGSVVKTDITQIRMLFIEETQDLNVTPFNEDT